MRRLVTFVCVWLIPGLVVAQSTCETRVDAHQQANTRQRVAYCLIPSYGAAQEPKAGLVFSGVSQRYRTVEGPAQEHATARDGSFRQDRLVVSQDFLQTRRFPRLTDGRASAQDVAKKQQAVQEGKAWAQAALDKTDCSMPQEDGAQSCTGSGCNAEITQIVFTEPPTEKQKKDVVFSPNPSDPFVRENEWGIKTRQNKPGRRLVRQRKQAQPQEALEDNVQAAPASTTDAGAYDEYNMPYAAADAPVSAQGYAPADDTDSIPQSYAPVGNTTAPASAYAPAQSYAPADNTPAPAPVYAPAPVSAPAQSYAPANDEMANVAPYSPYDVPQDEEIPLGTSSYAPAEE